MAEEVSIQGATQRALANGVTLRYCMQTVRLLRAQGVGAPLLFMEYIDPMLRYGMQRFCADAQAARVDSLIFPDLPPEESGRARRGGLPRARARPDPIRGAHIDRGRASAHGAAHARGFIFCVSVKGVTGVRAGLSPELSSFLRFLTSS